MTPEKSGMNPRHGASLRAPGARLAGWGLGVGAVVGWIGAWRVVDKNDYFALGLSFLAWDRLAWIVGWWAACGTAVGLAWFLTGRVAAFALGLFGVGERRCAAAGWLAAPLATTTALLAWHLNREFLPGILEPPSIAANGAIGAAAILTLWLFCALAERLPSVRSWRVPARVWAGALVASALSVVIPVTLRAVTTPEPSPGRPNLLVIVVDALRADRLGVYGSTRGLTPNLDRLAEESLLCREAYTPSSWTKPAIAGLFTSRYPREIGVDSGGWHRHTELGIEAAVLSQSALTLAELLRNAGFETAAFGKNHHLIPSFGFAQGFQTFRMDLKDSDNPEFSARAIRKHFERWLAKARAPFFAYLHYIDVHWPYLEPPAPFGGRFAQREPDIEYNHPQFVERVRAQGLSAVATPGTVRHMQARYDENVAYVDAQIGDLLDVLRTRGLYEDTWIVVTADHGEEFAEHGGLFHGNTLYEEVLRIPLLIKPARGSQGVFLLPRQRCTLLDLGPTLLRAAGVPSPSDSRGEALQDSCCDDERPVFGELGTLLALRRGAFKYIVDLASAEERLVDLNADPFELRPLPLNDETVAGLRELMWEFIEKTGKAARGEHRHLDAEDLERLRDLGYVD